MKIFVYEVRGDEREALARASEQFGAELSLSEEVPSLENAGLAAGCEGVSVLGQGKLDKTLLRTFRELGVKYLSTRTVGYNHIDLAAAKELGIRVCNARYDPNGVADYTVMLILMCLRHYKQALWRGQVNDFSLYGMQGRELRNLTVGIIGGGRIGRQVARNLSGFGCRILISDHHPAPEIEAIAEYVPFDTVIRKSDIITIHAPYRMENYHMINAKTIESMKDGVVIINCSRGELADNEALIEGIESCKIGALGIDVAEGEEGIIHADHRVDILANRNLFYLRQFRNVVMTQHMAFYTREAVESMVQCGIGGIVSMAEGKPWPTELNT